MKTNRNYTQIMELLEFLLYLDATNSNLLIGWIAAQLPHNPDLADTVERFRQELMQRRSAAV